MKEKKEIKLYLAILNKGWIRREIVQRVLPQMTKTPGVKVILANLSSCWDQPIFSNRNKITQRFMKTDCDYLMMLDDDVVPFDNPAELVHAEKDIIGCPAKVRANGRRLDWVAYMQNPEFEDYYTPIDLAKVPSASDLLKVDIIGSGLIIIHRRVFEKMYKELPDEAPWTIEINTDGTTRYGTDFAFCRRANKLGIDVWTTPWRQCEHIKQVGLLDIQGYDDSDYRHPGADKYRLPWGEFAICQKDWTFIEEVMNKYDVKNVLEFGSGLSSLLMAERAKVLSFETQDKWIKEINDRRKYNRDGGIYTKEQLKEIEKNENLQIEKWDGNKLNMKQQNMIRKGFDMVFVDGPLGAINNGPGREHSIKIASKKSDIVIIHDAMRQDEHKWQNKYLREDFDLISNNGNHQTRCHLWIRRKK